MKNEISLVLQRLRVTLIKFINFRTVFMLFVCSEKIVIVSKNLVLVFLKLYSSSLNYVNNDKFSIDFFSIWVNQ